MILINKIYSGNYLKKNIGHEFINDYISDDGKQYIYVTPWQPIRNSNDNENYIIQIRYAGKKRYEVLFYAKIESFSVDNNGRQLKYGGFTLNELLGNNDTDYQNSTGIYAHLKVEDLKRCKPNTFLCTKDSRNPTNQTEIELDKSFNFGRQRRYIYSGDVYDNLLSFIKDDTKWEDKGNSKLEIKPPIKQEINILDVVGKQYEELAFSNWLSFYLNNTLLCKEFIKNCLLKDKYNEESFNDLTPPMREFQKTDIWIESQKDIIVIENKIDSGINGVKQADDGSKTTQLDDYESLTKKQNGKETHYFIIKPNYNHLSINNGKWSVIEYRKIHEFFDKISRDKLFKDLPYIQEFVKALKPLTQSRKIDYKDIIENRLMERIAALNAGV